MKKEERVLEFLRLLDLHYKTKDKCYLNYAKPYELLISTILSAQCTDDRVNLITKDLFKKYQTLEDFAGASFVDMEISVKSAGFFRNKAKNIILMARRMLEVYDGNLPSSMEDLTSLAGVGRKTANVVRSHIYNLPSVVVDTHVKRISKKIGIVSSDDPVKIEFELMKILPKEHWIRYNTQVIAHGRAICKAPNPKCDLCFCTYICKEFTKK